MSRIEYDLLIDQRPDLMLPTYATLDEDTKNALPAISREGLVSKRTARILLSDHPTFWTLNCAMLAK